MNSQELLEYVRRAMDLEMDVYEAQQIQDKFYQSVKANKPRRPAEPRYEFGNGPLPPKEPEEDNLSVMAIITFFGAVALACMGVFAADGRNVTEASIAFFIFSGLSMASHSLRASILAMSSFLDIGILPFFNVGRWIGL